jgi:hypothetical protein
MFDARRPKGRLFYLVLGIVMMTSGIRVAARGEGSAEKPEKAMSSLPEAKPRTASPTPRAASLPPQSGPALTSVIEVRANNYGWGQANDRNLLGRFTTQTFGLARLARTQTYFLRLYDSSSPPKYSRYSAALHVDYPL